MWRKICKYVHREIEKFFTIYLVVVCVGFSFCFIMNWSFFYYSMLVILGFILFVVYDIIYSNIIQLEKEIKKVKKKNMKLRQKRRKS